MSRFNVNAARCEALFVSKLQRSDSPTLHEIHEAISQAVRDLGSRGCAASVAQEFGDHPETAVERMRWARQVVEDFFVARGARHPRYAEVRTVRFTPYTPAEQTGVAA